MLKKLALTLAVATLAAGCAGGSSTSNTASNSVRAVNEKAEGIGTSNKTSTEMKGSGDSGMFLTEAKKHRPAAPEDYTAKVGDKVLAEAFVGSWYSGTLASINGARKTMRYDDPANKPSEPVYTVVPLPTAANSPTPTEGQYLLIKPTSGDRWLYAQVTKVDGKSAEVRVEDGTTRTVAPGEFLTLETAAY